MLDQLPAQIWTPLIAATLCAGLSRGFSGFGAAMIFIPAASSLLNPKVAVPLLVVMDGILALPFAYRAWPKSDWRTVLPLALTSAATVGIGAWVVAHGDQILIRWFVSIFIALALCFLMAGWRYPGQPGWRLSMFAGGLSGFVSGLAQMGGAILVVFFLSGPYAATLVRANLFVVFEISDAVSLAAYWFHGILNWHTLQLLVVLMPIYGLALFAGSRLANYGSETVYRRLAYALIFLSATSSLPVFDSLVRG